MGGEIKMEMQDLIEAIGAEQVISELEHWLSSDELEDFIEDVVKDYDLDYVE